jgi:hypothetical protein
MDDLLDAKGQPLNLREPAASAARALKEKFPGIIFTSGRRDLRAQARAMSQNVAAFAKRTGKPGHQWLTATYKPSKALDGLVAWCKSHQNFILWAPIAQGFLSVLMRLPPDEAAKISRHLGGLAFDVRPVDGPEGEAIKAAIRALPHLDLFLDHEGGLVRLHAQFLPIPEST